MKNKLAQIGSALLAITMFGLAVVKAQGCTKNEKEDAHMPATKAGEFLTNEKPTANSPEQQANPNEGSAVGTNEKDAGNDSGSEEGANKPLEKMEVMPASKSGGFLDHKGLGLDQKEEKEKPKTQQQNAAPK